VYAEAPLPALALHVDLDSPLPGELGVGGGTALFVCGTCFHPEAKIRTLSILVDGQAQPVLAHGMPRLDFFRALHPGVDLPVPAERRRDPDSRDDPLLRAYRSGFWGIAEIEPGVGRERRLALRAELEGGGEAVAELARITVSDLPEPVIAAWPDPSPAEPRIAICMASYNPEPALLARQLDSIRAQTHRNWVCVISDDCSTPQAYRSLLAAVGDDPRFVVSRSPRRVGFYGNFERALTLAPNSAQYVAMADQDDRWYPDKLATLARRIGHAQLVYSDARIVTPVGEVMSDTYWSTRRNDHSDLLSLLVANAVTGAASLLRREVLDYALPFPPAQFAHFHDHWVALTALALGDIEFVDRPLYDYVQHGAASLGHAAATTMTPLAHRLAHWRGAHERVRMWRLHYFVDVCRLRQFATVLRLRCRERMSARKLRSLHAWLAADRQTLPLARLGVRGLRELVARTPVTLGAEWMLFCALLWRRLLHISARDLPQPRLRLDALPPPSLVVKPGSSAQPAAPAAIVEKIAPLDLMPSDRAPARINILIPTIDLAHFFGGYIAKFNLARRLAERGRRVRIVTVDHVPALPHSWKHTLESYSGLAGVFDHVEVAFGRDGAGIEVSPEDRFVATTWWTAHIAHRAVEGLGGERFVYLIQEYEPFTFPMGTYAALAEQSYRFPHFALFSSELLRGYFRRHGIGVYAAGTAEGDCASVAFENAITNIPPPSRAELAERRPRRLLFYARPEPHAARNMYELGLLALGGALERGAFLDGWELNGIGTVEGRRRIPLLGSASLNLLPRSDQNAYAELLRGHDLGLALMYTPHPSLVPIEMASAGMLAVTNSFENKTADAMAAISENIVAAEPSIDAVAEALVAAAGTVDDVARRARGAEVHWSRHWDRSFDDELLARLEAALGLAGAAQPLGSSR
jgi:glycosyltransferase involved in cell wall biosynthesis